jgi:hypothetical protein
MYPQEERVAICAMRTTMAIGTSRGMHLTKGENVQVQGNAYKLLGIIQSHAPNATAQQLVTNNVNAAALDGATEKMIEKDLAMALVDGLCHGNWPWTDYKAHD